MSRRLTKWLAFGGVACLAAAAIGVGWATGWLAFGGVVTVVSAMVLHRNAAEPRTDDGGGSEACGGDDGGGDGGGE